VKLAYWPTDVSEPGRGNFKVVPGSHLQPFAQAVNRVHHIPEEGNMPIKPLFPARPVPGRAGRIARRRNAMMACGAIAGAVSLAAGTPAAPMAAAATGSSPYPPATVSWHTCPQYSDAVLSGLGYPTSQQQSEFRKLWARTQCGTVQVPLDYSDPGGRQITIAITRLRDADQAHRLGSMMVNPGGPGGSGYLMPIQLATPGSPSAGLNRRYDLIGFDPRGVGYSTQANCAGAGQGSTSPPGLITEAEALQDYDAQVAANQECAQTDPAFLSQLTTANVARDMNQIRIALRQATISYFGVSWGTALGANYRSLFPGTVSRMWLDSVMAPDFRLDQYENGEAAATEQDFTRFTAWIAARNPTYGFGATAAHVKAALVRLENTYNAHPRQFTGLPEIGGSLIAESAAVTSQLWPMAAEVLKELRDAKGTTAPPELLSLLGQTPSAPPAGAPQEQNRTMNLAVSCNEDAGNRSFGASWAAYQQRLHAYPVVGQAFTPLEQTRCAGWPFPVQPWQLRRTGGSLELSGHRYDTNTPYQWTLQMQSVVGGHIYTVDDDIHAGAINAAACASHIIAYFNTGMPQTGHCPGTPVPMSTTPPPGTAG
jgi:pimeloyl-ACP methyl ester carboxylesterase